MLQRESDDGHDEHPWIGRLGMTEDSDARRKRQRGLPRKMKLFEFKTRLQIDGRTS